MKKRRMRVRREIMFQVDDGMRECVYMYIQNIYACVFGERKRERVKKII